MNKKVVLRFIAEVVEILADSGLEYCKVDEPFTNNSRVQYTVKTRYGDLEVTIYFEATGVASIYKRFVKFPKHLQAEFDSDFPWTTKNPHTNKWNIHKFDQRDAIAIWKERLSILAMVD